MTMKEKLNEARERALQRLNEAKDSDALEKFRIEFLSKKGELTGLMKGMGQLSAEERPVIGQLANEVRAQVEAAMADKRNDMERKLTELRLKAEAIDVTMDAPAVLRGNLHPLTQVLDEVKEIFLGMGFDVTDGPEIELARYNFDALNTPKNHPARSMSDTFYITDDILLRTQTSPGQIRAMETRKPPIRILSPGRVYRNDESDATHSPIFHQIEGLVIDKNVTMGDLKGTLDHFAKEFFGEDTVTRFRPHHFPFTEPSAEVDVSCFKCKGKGCSICKGSGWIEILGAGMVHPNVLRAGGIDPEEYSGFAFGMGLDRLTMLRYGITDIRLLLENDVRFLSEFK